MNFLPNLISFLVLEWKGFNLSTDALLDIQNAFTPVGKVWWDW